MIPKAKKNLHSCEYHIKNMLGSKHFEEVEINFAAFVQSARSVTFVLQKEFSKDQKFVDWYTSKQKEMGKDQLCKFFKELRNSVVKEGITGLHCSTIISSLNTSTDMLDKPEDAGVLIGSTGMYYLVKQGTPYEDRIPAHTKGKISANVAISGAPDYHLGKKIKQPNLVLISQLYYEYLKNLVEEWTGVCQDTVEKS